MGRTEPARGMRDFLPEDVRRREYVIGIVKKVYERYGYEPLETPAAENLETLMGKYGDEGNQLIFKILKRGEHEASGQADLALRYDLTVPLARVIAHHQSKLPRLFKRYQIQPVWRADRPARGRFREFYQCDLDFTGSTSPVVEAELCAAVSDVLTELGFNDFVVRLNHRQFLAALLNNCHVAPESHVDALVALDKLDKIGMEGVQEELTNRGLSADSRERLQKAVEFWGKLGPGGLDILPALDASTDGMTSAGMHEALRNLRAIRELLAESSGFRVRFDPFLARGLSYYTGAIMEINVPDLSGSLGGGGRYDNLVGMFLNQSIPACGFSLGLERILVVMGERGMFPPDLATTPADVMVAVFDAKDMAHAMRAAASLRNAGLRVLVYPDADKIGKQIKYADSRGIPFVAILGSDEIANGTLTVKHLAAKTQQTYEQGSAGAAIVKELKQRG
jgi:histidyl-tRNA synthetase